MFEASDARGLLWLHSETILLLSCGAAWEIEFLQVALSRVPEAFEKEVWTTKPKLLKL